MGLGFVGILGDKLPIEDHKKAAARKALAAFVSEKESGKWHLIVLDEVNVAVSLGLLTAKKFWMLSKIFRKITSLSFPAETRRRNSSIAPISRLRCARSNIRFKKGNREWQLWSLKF